MALKIQDLVDSKELEAVIRSWELVCGFQTVILGIDEKLIYASASVNPQSFVENAAGNMESIVVNGEKIGSIAIGRGQNNWETELIQIAKSAGAEEDSFRLSLQSSAVLSVERFEESKDMLVRSINGLLQGIYTTKNYQTMVERLSAGIEETQSLVKEIRKSTNDLKNIQSRQKILALNANIEAARAGEHGKGFGVVADEVGRLSDNSNAVNEKIGNVVKRISEVVGGLSIED